MVKTVNFELPHVQVAQSGREETINEAFVVLDALLAGVVKDAALTVPPVGPDEGEMWAVPAAATGLWVGQGGNLALFIGGGWVFKVPPASMEFFDETSGVKFFSTGVDWALKSGVSAYDIPLAFEGVPAVSQVMGRVIIPRAVTLPANFEFSIGAIGINPTASMVVDITDDGTSIGTATIATDGTFAFATPGGLAITIAPGSLLEFVAPAVADATAAHITFTLWGAA